jgi:hypothetical protein
VGRPGGGRIDIPRPEADRSLDGELAAANPTGSSKGDADLTRKRASTARNMYILIVGAEIGITRQTLLSNGIVGLVEGDAGAAGAARLDIRGQR